jgi:hypothetical protein
MTIEGPGIIIKVPYVALRKSVAQIKEEPGLTFMKTFLTGLFS